MSGDNGDKAKKDDKDSLVDYTEDIKRTLIAPQPSSPPSTINKDSGYREGDDVQPQVLKSLRGFLKATLDNSSNAFIAKDGFIESSASPEGSADPHFQQFTDVISDYEELNYGGPAQAKEQFFNHGTSDWWGALQVAGGHGSTQAEGPDGTISKNTIIDFDNPSTIHQLLASVIAGRNPDQRTDGTAGKPSTSLNVSPPWENAKLNKLREDDPGLNAALNMQQKISSILKYNRFSPGGDSPFIQSKVPTITLSTGQESVVLDASAADGSSQEIQFVGGERVDRTGGSPFSQQTELGTYQPDAVTVKWDDLRAIGIQLMVAATGQLDPDDFDINDASVDKFMADPIPLFGAFGDWDNVQMGRGKVVVGDLYAAHIANLLGIPAKTVIPDTEMQVEIDRLLPGLFYFHERVKSDKSYGTLNHPGEQYGNSNMVSPGMFLLVLTLLVFILALTFVLGAIFRGISGNIGGNSKSQRRPLGSSRINTRSSDFDFLLGTLGIPYTSNNIMSCISRGTALFFGLPPIEETWGWLGIPAEDRIIPEVPSSFESIVSKVMNFMYGPGYYISIMRRVAQDTEQIGEQLEKIGNMGAQAAPFGVPGPSGSSGWTAIFEIFNLISVFFDSTTLRWFMRAADVGDIYLNSLKGYGPIGTNPADLVPTPQNRIYKDRILTPNSPNFLSAHAFGTAQSVKLLPKSIIFGRARVGGDQAYRLLGETPQYIYDLGTKFVTPSAGSTIDPLIIKDAQDKLDSEYMPFWFQDLRTNEILSFHAFLTSVNENFTPDWSQEEGMGRVDDVMIYKKTGRSITMSFLVAAMHGKEELGYMWSHLDRFISMIYPQYTAGALYKTKDGAEFRMPFSQVMSASPLVRMRLGHLFGSNYSKFGIARLFGADDPTFGTKARDAKQRALLRELELTLVMMREKWNIKTSNQANTLDQILNPGPTQEGGTTEAWTVKSHRREGILKGNETPRQVVMALAPTQGTLLNVRAVKMAEWSNVDVSIPGIDAYKADVAYSYMWVVPKKDLKELGLNSGADLQVLKKGNSDLVGYLGKIAKKQQLLETYNQDLINAEAQLGPYASMSKPEAVKKANELRDKVKKLKPPTWGLDAVKGIRPVGKIDGYEYYYTTNDNSMSSTDQVPEPGSFRYDIQWQADPESQLERRWVGGSGWKLDPVIAGGLQVTVDNTYVVDWGYAGTGAQANTRELWYTAEFARIGLESDNNFSAESIALQKKQVGDFNNKYRILFCHIPHTVEKSPLNWNITREINGVTYESQRSLTIKQIKDSPNGQRYKALDKMGDINAANRLAANFFKSGYEGEKGWPDQAKKANPVIRSFETINRVGGGIGGLAGAITSLNLEYMDAPWEIEEDSKLPMWCAVNIEFSVIHDISPGLDYAGGQRAYIHPGGPDSYKVLAGDAKFSWEEEPPVSIQTNAGSAVS